MKTATDAPRTPAIRLDESERPWWQPPPSGVTVDYERKPILYSALGQPLVRRIGF